MALFFRRSKLLPPPHLLLLLLLLVLLHGEQARPTTADHDRSGGRRAKGPRGREPFGTLGTTTGATRTLTEGTKSGGPAPRGSRESRGEADRNLDVSLEFVDEMARARARADGADDGRLFDEPPLLTNPVPDIWVQRCSTFNRTDNFDHGAACGGPLAEPCFERRRCETGKDGAMLPKIYVYDQECSLAESHQMAIADHSYDNKKRQNSHWREAVWKAGMLAERYEEACLFIHVNTHTHDEPCATSAPLWNGGVNHIMMEFTPWWKEGREKSSISNTYAMDWAFDSLSCYYRSGFDLSLPLVPGKIFPEYESTPPTTRKHFMTFKGTLYLRGYGLEERSAVSRVHDPANRIISVIKCSNMHGDELLPENRDYCDRSVRRYDTYDYADLMNTTFALVPSGRSPGTFRLGEVMSAGAIPVFVVRDWIKPFQEQIDWPSFSFTFTPDQVGPSMVQVLRAVPPDQLRFMQRKSLEAYWKIFGGATNYSVIAANTIDALAQRLRFHR